MHQSPARTVSAAALQAWIARILISQDLPGADAARVADALVDSSLRGVDTHGVVMLPGYLDLLARGVTNPRPAIAMATHGALLQVDADRGLGQAVMMRVLEAMIALARSQGSATATVGRVGHLGALGYFTRKASEAGMLALLMQNGPPVMGLPGSTRRAIGNNPISFAAPVTGRPPIVFDVAASEAAYGKVIQAAGRGETIPGDWAMDMHGNRTRDPSMVAGGMLLPFGGYKGIGLAMMVEVFAGSLTGTRPAWGEFISGAFLLLVNPEDAAGRSGFDVHLTEWLDYYMASSPDARYPGQKAEAVYRQRSREGIPIDAELQVSLETIGRRADAPFPG